MKLSLRTKLVVTFLIVGLLPMLISNLVIHKRVGTLTSTDASEQAQLVANGKSEGIASYFSTEANALADLADNPLTGMALKELATEFNQMANLPKDRISAFRDEVKKFYSGPFASSYTEKNGRTITIDGFVEKLDSLSVAAQHDFIAANPNPLGKKDLMVESVTSTSYSKVHSKYHTFFRNYLVRHGLYDVFLVTPDGRVVYTVFKELDFATSLSTGPWADTGLAKAFNASAKLENLQVHLEDFAIYTPSYESPASFMSSPIYLDGKFIGSLIVQMPLDKISAVAGKRDGLGEKGETLLLGSDLKLRADTFRNKEKFNVATSFQPNSQVNVMSEAVKRATEGKTGFMFNVSYDGLRTLAYYSPIKILDHTWYIVTELSEEEMFKAANSLNNYLWGILAGGALFILLVAFWYSAALSKVLTDITSILNKTSDEVSQASFQSASSATELSEASTEQAASLQETMASIEEISAMVNQNAESAAKANLEVTANQKSSEEGTLSMQQVLRSIEEIKQTNDEILGQMETSNQEFAEIVKIISEIGTKTNVINEIVFQTKLLSFNASVEAARAGEHGKGFAVVAEEVGNLAQMSGNAAKEITDMLANSVKKVNQIVEQTRGKVDRLVEIGKDKISMGVSTAQKCNAVLEKINENARVVTGMISEIAHASKEQAQGVQEINKAILQLDQVTQQNSTVAQQSSSQSENLNAEAKNLTRAVLKLVVFVEGTNDSPEKGTSDLNVAKLKSGPTARVA